MKLTLRPELRYLQIGHPLAPVPRFFEFWPTLRLFWAVQCSIRLTQLPYRNMCMFLMSLMRRRAAMRQALGTPLSVFSHIVVGPCWGLSLGGSGHTFWYRPVPRHRMQATWGKNSCRCFSLKGQFRLGAVLARISLSPNSARRVSLLGFLVHTILHGNGFLTTASSYLESLHATPT